MNMLDIHADALVSVNEAYHKFLLRYRKGVKVVYGFVEGKDDPMFYRAIIERFLPDDWAIELIPAGRRDKVIAAYNAFNWSTFSDKQIAFFVDRDLTSFLPEDAAIPINVYVTDGYSIENDIVNQSVFMRLLVEACNVVDYTAEEQSLLLFLFNEDLLKFKQFMAPIMAQVLAWRRDAMEANLNDLDLSPYFRFEGGRLCIIDDYLAVDQRLRHLCDCVGATPHEPEVVNLLKQCFIDGGGLELFVRGKYLVWFLAKSVAAFHAEIHRFVSAYSRPPKLKVSFGPANVMVIAAPRARIPPSLKTFIESTFLVYARHQAEFAKQG